MKDFVRVATACPKGRVADPEYNLEQMLILARKAEEEKVSLLVYPELCLTSYTAMDMIYQRSLLEGGTGTHRSSQISTANRKRGSSSRTK